MDIERLLTESFANHEHLTPDERVVRARIEARLARRARLQGRTLAVAASVAAVAAAAVAGSLLAPSHDRSAVHPARHPACAATATGSSPDYTGAADLPFRLRYLPAGRIDWQERGVGIRGSAQPPVTAADVQLRVAGYLVEVMQIPAGTKPLTRSGGERAVTLAGERAYESVRGGQNAQYGLVYLDAHDGTRLGVSIVYDGASRVSAARLTLLGRRVAEGVTLSATTRVPLAFALGPLPSGSVSAGFFVQGGRSDCVTQEGTPPTGTRYEVLDGNGDEIAVGTGLDVPAGTPQSRTVQGRPTRYGVKDGQRTLQIEDAVVHSTVALSSRTASQATLYRIADGLQLPSR